MRGKSNKISKKGLEFGILQILARTWLSTSQFELNQERENQEQIIVAGLKRSLNTTCCLVAVTQPSDVRKGGVDAGCSVDRIPATHTMDIRLILLEVLRVRVVLLLFRFTLCSPTRQPTSYVNFAKYKPNRAQRDLYHTLGCSKIS